MALPWSVLSVGQAPSTVHLLFGGAGFSAGLCWVGAAYGINYLFERRPLGLWAINAGYHTLQFTLFGLIVGLMH